MSALHTIKLSSTLALPLDVVTETIAVLGIRGSGKTNTCVVMTEELLDAGQQVVVIDPTDAWWGLRSSKDGSRAAYKIVVFGGRHGDVPLNAGDGALIADAIVDNQIPAILSLRHFESQADQRRLVTDFARRIYHRKGEEGRDTPTLLVIDEAHLFCPQRVGAAEAQMVGAIQKIVRQGRSSGLGVALIDQRAASVNKDLLTQLELLVAHRTSSPQDRKALEAWIEQHDTNDDKSKFLERLASLERGTAWFWSPGWLDLFKEVHVRERRTFDSSATPKAGERAITPTKLADIDLDALRTKLATSIEQAKADDPKVLRARIVELERELAKKPTVVAQTVEREVERIIVDKDLAAMLDRLDDVAKDLKDRIGQAWDRALHPPQPTTSVVVNGTLHGGASSRAASTFTDADSRHAEAPKSVAPPRGNGSSTLGGGERKILTALAQYPAGRTKVQVALLTGYAHNGGGFSNYISSLRGRGLLEGDGGRLTITEAGCRELGAYTPLPTGKDLLEHWKGNLEKAPRMILEELASVYPRTLRKDAVASRTGYEVGGGGFNNALSRLRTLELISGKAELRASEELFS
jgi:hypothetical protein